MARSIARRLVGRVYWSLPRSAQTRVRGALGPLLKRHRFRGVEWAAEIPTADRRPVSIVIPSYDDLRYLVPLLASIRETCSGWDYEVVIVDDSGNPALRPGLLALEDERVRVVIREENGGFGRAVNTGLALARHDVALLNSDTVALPGWLDALQRAAYEVDPRIGMVSGMLVYPDGLVQYGGTYHTRSTNPQWFGHLWVGRPASSPEANRPAYIRAISGACVYVRREVIEEIGGFDDGYWLGFEDVDWGMRAWRAGWRCWYEPAAKLIHHESATRGYSQGRRELASMRYFWRRWRAGILDRGTVDPPPIAVIVGAAAPPLWRAWVDEVVEGLRDLGTDATVVSIAPDGVDEVVLREITAGGAVPIAADAAAATTAWLAAEQRGVGLQLLPGGDPGVGAAETPFERAMWRPEFDFVAPSATVAERLTANSSWLARDVVPPVLAPRPVVGPPSTRSAVVLVGDAPTEAISAIRRAAGDAFAAVAAPVVTPATLDAVLALAPRVVVCLGRFEHALVPMALSGLGGAFVGALGGGAGREVMDGLSALLVDPSDPIALERALRDLLERDDVVDEIEANARQAAASAALAGPRSLLRAIRASLDVA